MATPIKDIEKNKDIKLDYLSGTNPIYVGWAVPGTSDSDSKWRIIKLTWDSNNNPTSKKYADGVNTFTKCWNDRGSYVY